MKAVLFSREGNATVGTNYQVSIIGTKDKLDDKAGNIFICDKSDAVTLDIENHSLVITHDQDARVFQRIDEFMGITVWYKVAPKR